MTFVERNRGRWLPAFFVVLVFCLIPDAAADSAGSLDLNQLVLRALEHNPRMGMARADLDAARARVGQQYAARFPTVAVEGRLERATLNSAPPVEANPYLDFSSVGLGRIPIRNADTDLSGFGRASAALSAEYLLIDFGRRKAAEEVAEQSLEAVRADLVGSRNDTVLEVVSAYFGLLRELALADVESGSRNRKREALRIAREFYEAGRSAAGDVARAEADLAGAEVDLTRAHKRVELARLALRRAVGEPPDAPPLKLRRDSRLPKPDGILKDIDTLLEQALSQRPEIESRKATIAASRAQVRNRSADILPAVSLVANLSEQSYLNGDTAPNYVIGVKLGWTLFDGGLRRSRTDEARAQLIRDQERLREQTLDVVSNIRDARYSYLEAKRRLALTREVVDASTLDLKLARAGYREGMRSFYDLSLAESGLRNARSQRIAAEYDLQSSIARLYWALGAIEGLTDT